MYHMTQGQVSFVCKCMQNGLLFISALLLSACGCTVRPIMCVLGKSEGWSLMHISTWYREMLLICFVGGGCARNIQFSNFAQDPRSRFQ